MGSVAYEALLHSACSSPLCYHSAMDDKRFFSFPDRTQALFAVCAFLLAGGFAFLLYSNRALVREVATLRKAYEEDMATTTAHLAALEEQVGMATHESQKAVESVASVRSRSKTLEEKVDTSIKDISGTVGDLKKLAETDPQLLQKYSKVYFLNENYLPEDLAFIDEQYDFKDGKQVRIESHAAPFLENLLEAAHADGIELFVLSGYRSFDEQRALKSTYKVTYGAGTANQFSADQGYSEHQLGTTIDFTTPKIGTALASFDTTDAYAWLLAHAYEYGFVLSYPKGNAYYIYEPWHWRFVGKALAKELHDKEKYFYDMDQRTIDTYLPKLFDE